MSGRNLTLKKMLQILKYDDHITVKCTAVLYRCLVYLKLCNEGY